VNATGIQQSPTPSMERAVFPRFWPGREFAQLVSAFSENTVLRFAQHPITSLDRTSVAIASTSIKSAICVTLRTHNSCRHTAPPIRADFDVLIMPYILRTRMLTLDHSECLHIRFRNRVPTPNPDLQTSRMRRERLSKTHGRVESGTLGTCLGMNERCCSR
jgi:hypothetical protein